LRRLCGSPPSGDHSLKSGTKAVQRAESAPSTTVFGRSDITLRWRACGATRNSGALSPAWRRPDDSSSESHRSLITGHSKTGPQGGKRAVRKRSAIAVADCACDRRAGAPAPFRLGRAGASRTAHTLAGYPSLFVKFCQLTRTAATDRRPPGAILVRANLCRGGARCRVHAPLARRWRGAGHAARCSSGCGWRAVCS
jgi:hypothetical protein